MRDLLGWNLSLGRWAGVHVRLHFFFVLVAVLAVSPQWEPVYGLAVLSILLVSVLAHEIGHCIAARRLGGRAEEILLWPFGGLASIQIPHDPRSDLAAALAGPAVNLLIGLIVLPVMLLLGHSDLLRFNPLEPPYPADGWSWPPVLALVFWINWMLLVVNLLPAYPLDGGRALRALLWPALGYRRALLYVSWAARLTGVLLCVVGWLVHASYPFAWTPLALFGIFLFFSARQDAERLHEQEGDDELFGYDFSQGYTSLEKAFEAQRKHRRGPLGRWLDRRRQARAARQQEIEIAEDQRVDDVLARLHLHGFDQLSAEDQALLKRVSARYRDRQ